MRRSSSWRREQVDRLAAVEEGQHRVVDRAVGLGVEVRGPEDLDDARQRLAALEQDGAEHGALGVEVVRRDARREFDGAHRHPLTRGKHAARSSPVAPARGQGNFCRKGLDCAQVGDKPCKAVHNDPRTGDSRCINVGPEDRDPRGRVINGTAARYSPRTIVTLQLGGDVGVQSDRHARLAQGLHRLVEVDPPPLDLDSLPLEEVRDVLRGDRAEELALFRGLAALLVAQRLDPPTERLGVFLDAIGLGLLLLLDVVQVLEVPRAGAQRQPLGDEKVARVAVGHVTHLAPTPDRRHVVQQDDFHARRPSLVATYGSRATVRARLMAWVS